MTQTQQTVIALVIFSVWLTFLYIITFDKTLKKYILSIGFLLVFWMIVRILKPYTNGKVTQLFWYLYYVPLLLIPTFYYNCSSYLVNSKKKNIRIFTIIVSIILFLMVITNNIHNFVFKLTDDIDDYTHNIGYFIIVLWMLTLIVLAIKNLVKSSKEKRIKNIIAISIVVLIGLLYTILYVKNIPVIRHTNMSVIVGILFGIGLELLFDFKLIPNNFKYKKIFKDSNLPIEIISNDGKKKFNTKHYIKVEDSIIEDVKKDKVKNTYYLNNKIKNIKKIHGGFAIEEKDLSKVNELKEDLQVTNKELLLQEQVLKNQKKIETKMYEAKIKNEIIELLDDTIEQKKNLIIDLLGDMETMNFEKLKIIKLLISYCKRMSSLVISSYNKEKYNEKRLEIICNELFLEAKALNINGILQSNSFEITTSETANIYEVIFETVINLKNIDFILNLKVTDLYVEFKYLFDRNLKDIKNKLEQAQLERVIEIEEKIDDNETILKLVMLRGEN